MSHEEKVSPVVKIQHLEILMLLSCNSAQSRVALNESKIEEYAGLMSDGVVFEPGAAFFDGSNYHLASGEHRLRAALKAGFATFPVEVREGTERDARLFSIQDNIRHGAPLTPEDKRNAASILLRDSEWGLWGDNEIARRTGLCSATVKKLRDALFPTTVTPPVKERKATRNGKTYTIKVDKIGKSKTPKKKQATTTASADGTSEPVTDLKLPAPESVVPATPSDPVIAPVLSKATESDFSLQMVNQVASAEAKPAESTPPVEPKIPTPNWFGKATEVLLGNLKSFDGSEAIIIIPGKKKAPLFLDLVQETCEANGATVLATPAAALEWKAQNVSDKEHESVLLEINDTVA